LEQHFANETDMNMDLIYTVIDNYRHAIVLTREVEVLIERSFFLYIISIGILFFITFSKSCWNPKTKPKWQEKLPNNNSLRGIYLPIDFFLQ